MGNGSHGGPWMHAALPQAAAIVDKVDGDAVARVELRSAAAPGGSGEAGGAFCAISAPRGGAEEEGGEDAAAIARVATARTPQRAGYG